MESVPLSAGGLHAWRWEFARLQSRLRLKRRSARPSSLPFQRRASFEIIPPRDTLHEERP